MTDQPTWMSFEKIASICKYFLRNKGDWENLAADVFAKQWERQKAYSYLEVKHDCFDLLRHLRVGEQHHDSLSKSMLLEFEHGRDVSSDTRELVHRLMETAGLSLDEKKLLHLLYYTGASLSMASSILGTSTGILRDRHGCAIEKLQLEAMRRE